MVVSFPGEGSAIHVKTILPAAGSAAFCLVAEAVWWSLPSLPAESRQGKLSGAIG
jgi:hypothetical protein